ncbi:hypothetical protein FRC04_002180 [Tulasnella sp. 424]|nr:hypothetical protein FRC04_002180 [Tulasnella sp. 424]KAG8967822.1 hypothetical protein FRC05_001918 [Tulasnella sp. 425]
MSHLDVSQEELLDAMSSIIPIFTESVETASPPLNPFPSFQNPTEGVKHPEFYFGDFIDVHVEHMVYSFPSALIESSILKRRVKGLKGNDRLVLEGMSPSKVQAFLEVADARLVSGDKHFKFQQWASALSAADHLKVAHIRTYIVKSMEDGLNRLDPFDCIDVAEGQRVQDWLLQPFRRICERPEPLSPSEMVRLGWERAGAVAKAREKLMKLIHSGGLFDNIYGGSDLSSSDKTTLAGYAVQVVKEDPLLCQLAPEQPLGVPVLGDHTDFNSSRLTSSSLTDMKARKDFSSLRRIPCLSFDLGAGLLGPLVLPEDLSTSDWEIFLKIITARPYDQSEASHPFSEWMSALRVARKLDHDSAPAYIFGRIQAACSDQDAVDLLEAARLAEAPHSPWLQSRYASLSTRATSISWEEMCRMGEKASAEVCKLREQAAYNRGKAEGEATARQRNSGRYPYY